MGLDADNLALIHGFMGFDSEREHMEDGALAKNWVTVQLNLFLSNRLDTRMTHTVFSLKACESRYPGD